MPALDMAAKASFHDLEQTANLLASGFESLLAEVGSLAHREQYLKSRLDFAQDEVRTLLLLHRFFPHNDEHSQLALDQELSLR